MANTMDKDTFIRQLKSHQKGETDYLDFGKDCASTGVEKWIVDLETFTCMYYDKAGNKILTEGIPH